MCSYFLILKKTSPKMMYIYSKINIPSIRTNQTKEIMQKRKKKKHKITIYFFRNIWMIYWERKGERERDWFNKLAQVIVQCGYPGKRWQFESKGSLLAEFCLLEKSVFFLLRLSTDWMRPTYIREGNLLYSNSTDLNVNLT